MAAAMVTVTNKFKIKSAKAIKKLHSFFFFFGIFDTRMAIITLK